MRGVDGGSAGQGPAELRGGCRDSAQCLGRDRVGGAKRDGTGDCRANLIGGELVLGAAEDDGLAAGRGLCRRGGHGGGRRGLGPGVDGIRKTGAGDGDDLGGPAEFGDQPALVGARRGGRGGPDRHDPVGGGRGFDGRHRADDRDSRLELGPQRLERVHRPGIARHDEDIGLVPYGGTRTEQGAVSDVSGRPRTPRHSIRVGGQHKVSVGPQPVQRDGRGQQAEPGIDQRDPHEATLGRHTG